MFALISAACVKKRELVNDGAERYEWHFLAGPHVSQDCVLLKTAKRTVWAEKRAMNEVVRQLTADR